MPSVNKDQNMKIRYVTTDLDFESQEDLSPIVLEFGNQALPSHNNWTNDKYFVVLASASNHDEPEKTIAEFCDLIEGLSSKSKKKWYRCQKRVADIAFESGETPNNLSCQLSESLISRLNTLKISIVITIYPIGHYSYLPIENQA